MPPCVLMYMRHAPAGEHTLVLEVDPQVLGAQVGHPDGQPLVPDRQQVQLERRAQRDGLSGGVDDPVACRVAGARRWARTQLTWAASAFGAAARRSQHRDCRWGPVQQRRKASTLCTAKSACKPGGTQGHAPKLVRCMTMPLMATALSSALRLLNCRAGGRAMTNGWRGSAASSPASKPRWAMNAAGNWAGGEESFKNPLPLPCYTKGRARLQADVLPLVAVGGPHLDAALDQRRAAGKGPGHLPWREQGVWVGWRSSQLGPRGS